METSTAGATSRTTSSPSIQHDVELTERHSISLRAGDLPDNGAGAIDVLRLHAQAYARDRGFEITGGIMARVSTPVPDPREQIIAVEFDVIVGKGHLGIDRPEDDTWVWSFPALDHNWRLLDGALSDPEDRPRRRRVNVRPEGQGGAGGGKVVPMPGVVLGPGGGGVSGTISGQGGRGGMPGGWQGGPAIRGEGIAPPIHPAWSDPDHPVSKELRETYAPPIPPVDQRPPWMRRGEGWDEDGEGPLGEQRPPGLD
ncbi:hypothetical protein I5G58_gp079 [Mycobacterium phage BirdsNest]|uniref:Uncharacterized protein n=1 Tax=Mycobacterium phage BirdsNest TaxID=2686231 RepID=A0A6B9LD84_9CAUD|nr:hypothetical protein I5G58_gp079 [Mycobacterium phage BirdsNest]QHB37381.1 hypothetical protein PBI_BIRDSNEST_79 [Mycobacterium phage BirdsNest]